MSEERASKLIIWLELEQPPQSLDQIGIVESEELSGEGMLGKLL